MPPPSSPPPAGKLGLQQEKSEKIEGNRDWPNDVRNKASHTPSPKNTLSGIITANFSLIYPIGFIMVSLE
jgi:hypothetical protein